MKATQEKFLYRMGWERVFGSRKEPLGQLYFLPTEATSVIVQYEPDFRITCLLPPKIRTIDIQYKEKATSRKVRTPTLLISHLFGINSSYPQFLDRVRAYVEMGEVDPQLDESRYSYKTACDCEDCEAQAYAREKALIYERKRLIESYSAYSCYDHKTLIKNQHPPICCCTICEQVQNQRVQQNYYLYALHEKEQDSILAQPFRLNNVYDDARMCFRHKKSTMQLPKNLRQAHAIFWMHRFNNDFGTIAMRFSDDDYNRKSIDAFADGLVRYKPDPHLYEVHTYLICGDRFFSSPKKQTAVFTSFNPTLLDMLHPDQRKTFARYPDFKGAIGFANPAVGKNDSPGWKIELGAFEFFLAQNQVKVVG